MIIAKNKALSLSIVATLVLAGCDSGLDLGRTGLGNGGYNLNDKSGSGKTAPRPKPDARGVISYANYQVVVAKNGDTVNTVAQRIGMETGKLARHNGLGIDQVLRAGEVLAIPGRITAGTGIDIAEIAGNAINTAGASNSGNASVNQTGIEPIRHKVERGESAYSIARLYDVSVTSLASWNGLGTDLAVRQGQQLLIPIVETPRGQASASNPGAGTATPVPPSASKPMPKTAKAEPVPASPDLGKLKSSGASRKFLTPVVGKIISKYSGKSGGNEGIDIAASKGTAVKAAEDGEVALISKSVGSNTIVLIRHSDNIYTVYSNVAGVKLTKGQKVRRGQRIGGVADGSPAHLHFEVRKGTQSVDPEGFL